MCTLVSIKGVSYNLYGALDSDPLYYMDTR